MKQGKPKSAHCGGTYVLFSGLPSTGGGLGGLRMERTMVKKWVLLHERKKKKWIKSKMIGLDFAKKQT